MPSACLVAVLLLLDVATPTASQAAEAAIKAPVQVNVGRLVVLTAEVPNAKALSWLHVNPPEDDDHQIVDGGTKLIFATGIPGDYLFVLAAALEGSDGKTTLVQVRHMLKVRASGSPPAPVPTPTPVPVPVPTPTPTPVPTPIPVPPDGQFGLVSFCRDMASTIVTTDPKKVTNAKILAVAYGVVSAKIASGSVPATTEKIMEAQGAINKALLGDAAVAWNAFFASLAAKLSALHSSGHLNSKQAWAEAWNEIAVGLGEVK